MANPHKYWVCGLGFIHHFDGNSWVAQDVSGVTGYPLNAINAIHGYDDQNLYAIGLTSPGPTFGVLPVFLHTTDGGTTWTEIATTGLPDNPRVFVGASLHVFSDTEIYVGGHKWLTNQGLMYKWNGSIWTNVFTGPGGEHVDSLWGTSGTDLYHGTTNNEYYYNFAAQTIAGWDDYDAGTMVAGNTTNQVAVSGQETTNPGIYKLRVSRGSHAGGWVSDNLKDDFHMDYLNYPRHALDVDSNGYTFLISGNRATNNMEVAVYKSAWVYDVLGQYSGETGVIAASAQGLLVAVYNKITTGNLTSWFYNGSVWTQNDTMPVETNAVKGAYGYQAPSFDPPFLDNEDPAPNSTVTSKSKRVDFSIEDDSNQVVQSTIQIFIRGVLVYSLATGFTSGWDVGSSIVANANNGFDLKIQPSKNNYWRNKETVAIHVIAENILSGLLDTSYSFFTDTSQFPFKIYKFLAVSVREMDEK